MKRHNAALFLLFILPTYCLASTTGVNAWEGVLTKIVDSLTGPVMYSLSIISIFVCGLTMAFTDMQGAAKSFIQVACGLSVSMFAAKIITGFFGFQGALI